MIPEPPSAAPKRSVTRLAELLRLRLTLVSTIVGLIVLTGVAVGGSAAVLTWRSTRALLFDSRGSAIAASTVDIHQFFEVAPNLTDELAAQARRGALPINDSGRLAAFFAERLRKEVELAQIGYGDRETGRYVAATRDDAGEIDEYIADPAVAGGRPMQFAIAADGTVSKSGKVETAPYLVDTKDWFRLGIAESGAHWGGFFHSESGRTRITSTTRLRFPGSNLPAGLFRADLRVGRIAPFLSTLQIGRHGAVFLDDRSGHRLASPIGPNVAAEGAAVDAAADRGISATADTEVLLASGGDRYDVEFVPIVVRGGLGLDIAVDIDLSDIAASVWREAIVAVIAAVSATLLALLVGGLLAGRLVRPILAIAADLEHVGAFQISQAPSPRSFVREIARLGDAVDRMKASLRSFGRYVPTDLVRALLAQKKEAELGGEIRRLTIHFSDVADFTTMSEGMEPQALVEAMGRYFELMTAALTEHGGTVDKFMGDGIMAFFNAPADLPDHARQACLAALDAQAALAEMARLRGPGEPAFSARIGLGLGDVLVGNIGTSARFAYTLIGDEVNLASRLEGLNKVYGTAIMASDAVVADAGDAFEWRRLDKVAVKGRQQGTVVYELLGLRGAVPADRLAARDRYEAAFDAYLAGDFATAATGFDAAAALRPGDLGAVTMAARARDLAAAPPADWTGVHVMHEK